MKKILLSLAVLALVLNVLAAIAIPDEKTKQEKMTLSFSQPSVHEKDDCVVLEMGGANSALMKEDHYMVPAHLVTFTFPFGTEIKNVQCTPRNIQRQTVAKKLMVAPEPVMICRGAQKEQVEEPKRVTPKSPDTWYEYDVGTGLINENQRGVIVKVKVLPVQYNSSENLIKWAGEVDIDITYGESGLPLKLDDQYTFLVLSPADFSDELDVLIQHKNDNGIPTLLVSLDDIYNGVYFPVEGRDAQEKIKYFIKNAIENWNVTRVLLVGGSATFPTRLTHVRAGTDTEIFVSDLYYADIYDDTGGFCSWDSNGNSVFGEFNWGSEHLTDDVDLYPDVYLGRLTCASAYEVTTSVNKIITYETNEAYTQGWFHNLVLIGGDTFTYDEQDVDEGEYMNDAVADVMAGFMPDRVWASNGRLGGSDPTGAAEISRAIGAGVGFVDFSGHGYIDTWGTHPHGDESTWLPTPLGGYASMHIVDLQNADELPIVVSGGCTLGKFDTEFECFCWSFVSNPDGGGIGSFGPTGYAWAYMGEWVTEGLLEGMALNTFDAYMTGGATTFGEMWVKAITNYIYPDMDGKDYKTIEEWEPFGDPTLAVAGGSHPPGKPDAPSGPTEGEVGWEYLFSSIATDPDGDSIFYFFDWGDGTNSDWLGPYGSGDTGTASHSWMNPGIWHVKVKAKDRYDHVSIWSDSLSVAVYICGDCTGEGIIDVADVVYLINYLFIGGSAPDPVQAGDVNLDGVVNIADVVYLVNYLFADGPPPCI